MKKVSVVGLGYIGLPTAIAVAEKGLDVFGFDVDTNKVNRINSGDPTIVEPEIAKKLERVLNKNFRAYEHLQKADYFIVAVPTPIFNNKADLSYVYEAAKAIAQVLEKGNLVILESTVSVNTTEEFAKILERESGLKTGEFFVAYCPERVLPGKIFKELISNDRVVGGICEKSGELARQFYGSFVKGDIYVTDSKTAEMVKLVENSSRDVQIAFSNQVASMCKEVGINPFEVIDIANKHPRVDILNPGCGVGGHCIAVDPWFLVESFPKSSVLLKNAREINDAKAKEIVESTLSLVKKFKKAPRVLALGLAFKPNVDDLRNSPALEIATSLRDKNIDLSVCEPNVDVKEINKLGFDKVVDLVDGIENSDIILILVNHKPFSKMLIMDLSDKAVIDTCGILYKKRMGQVKFFVGAKLTRDELTKDEHLSDILLMP